MDLLSELGRSIQNVEYMLSRESNNPDTVPIFLITTFNHSNFDICSGIENERNNQLQPNNQLADTGSLNDGLFQQNGRRLSVDNTNVDHTNMNHQFYGRRENMIDSGLFDHSEISLQIEKKVIDATKTIALENGLFQSIPLIFEHKTKEMNMSKRVGILDRNIDSRTVDSNDILGRRISIGSCTISSDIVNHKEEIKSKTMNENIVGNMPDKHDFITNENENKNKNIVGNMPDKHDFITNENENKNKNIVGNMPDKHDFITNENENKNKNIVGNMPDKHISLRMKMRIRMRILLGICRTNMISLRMRIQLGKS